MSSLKRHSVPLKSSTYVRLLSSSLSHIHVHTLLNLNSKCATVCRRHNRMWIRSASAPNTVWFPVTPVRTGEHRRPPLSLSLFALANNCEDETLSQEILWHTSPQHLYTCTWAAAADTQSHRVGSSVTDNCTSGISSHTHTFSALCVCDGPVTSRTSVTLLNVCLFSLKQAGD